MIIPSPKLTVLHIEEDWSWRNAVASALSQDDSYELLDCAVADGTSGLQRARELQPDIVLVDLEFVDASALALARELAVLPGRVRVVVSTSRIDEFRLYHLSRTPIQGIVWKGSGFPDEWLEALAAARDWRLFRAARIRADMQLLRASPTAFFKILSDRELELLPLFGYGLSDEQVAERTSAVAATIKSHRRRIMSKLGIHRTEDLMRWAAQRGFCDLSQPAPPCEVVR